MSKNYRNEGKTGEKNELATEGQLTETADTKGMGNTKSISVTWLFERLVALSWALTDPTLITCTYWCYQTLKDVRCGNSKSVKDLNKIKKKVTIRVLVELIIELFN
jgi:hypothetical protein